MAIDSAWSRDFKVFIRLETYDFKKNEELCYQSTSIAMLTDSKSFSFTSHLQL